MIDVTFASSDSVYTCRIEDEYSPRAIAYKVNELIDDSYTDCFDPDLHSVLDALLEDLLYRLGYHEAVDLVRTIDKEYG